MTELTPILNSVHTYKDSLQILSVPLSVFTSIESDCRERGEMMEMTSTLKSVHTSNDSLH
jgi:hypothetical protein